MGRGYPDYLQAYLRYSEHTEPPISYHIWTCLSIIAAALQRRVYLQWGFRRIYPNMYVVLIGPSGARKGTAMTIGKDLLGELQNVKMSSESISREALIRDMREGVQTYIDPFDGMAKFHCALSVFSEELSVFLGQSNVKFLADLTDWFDCSNSWTYRTKNSGTDQLTGVCVNLLGATASDWLKSILPTEAFGGGFTSRVIFVVEEGKGKHIADPTLDPAILDMRKTLVKDLQQIHEMCGPMSFPKDTLEIYKEWYIKQSQTPAIKDPHFAGYCERRAIHVLKLSICVSASRGNDRIITPGDFNRALKLLSAIEPKMPRTFMGLGKAKYSDLTQSIFDYLRLRGKVTRSELLEKFHLDLDEYSLKIIMQTLSARKVVSIRIDTGRDEQIYTLLVKQ